MLRSTVTGELAPEDHGHHPRRREIHLDQRDERGGDQQLVGQRIHELPERRDLLAPPREVAVEPVGQRGDAEDRRADELLRHAEDQAPLELRQQHDDQQRHEEDAAERQRVRKIHALLVVRRERLTVQNTPESAASIELRRPALRYRVSSGIAMKAILLAGGKGTRLRPLTVHTPKPIVPIFNRPFLYYQIDLLRQVPEIDEVILSLNYQPRRIEEIFGEGEGLGVKLRYVVEPMPLGTGGAIRYAGDSLTESVVVFNGDVLTQVDLGAVLRLHRERKAKATIVLTPVENPRAYGLVETDADGNVQRFLEKPGEDEITCNTINAGIYVLEPDTFDRIPKDTAWSIERSYFPSLIERGETFVAYVYDGYWIDIGTPAKYLQVHRDIMDGRYSAPPFARTPQAAWVSPEARVEEGVELHGPCFVDEGAVLKAGARDPALLGASDARRTSTKARLIDGVDHLAERLDRPRGRRARIDPRPQLPHRPQRRASKHRSVLGDKTVITDYSRL